jgi:hypothetical protein
MRHLLLDPLRLGAACLVPVLAAMTNASAQPVFDPPDPARVTLETDAIEIEGIGLRLRPPAGHELSTNSRGGLITTSLRLPGDLGAISIQLRTDPDQPTLIEIEERIIEDLLGLPASSSGLTIDTQVRTEQGDLLGRSPIINTGTRVIRPFYFLLREGGRTLVRGVAVIPLTADEHAMVNLLTREASFETAREIFEVMLGSVEVADFVSIDAQRGEAVDEGVRALASLTTADFDAVVTDVPEQFERIYRPVPGGAAGDEAEVGYRRIRAWIGPRSDLTTREPDEGRDPSDSDGYLLRIDGLVFLDDGRRADSRAIYYLSRDRRQEAWTVEMAIRDTRGGKPEVWTEIGARSGRSMTVQISSGGKSSHTARPLIEGEGYVSRLESYLLPELLIRAGAEGEFAFYAYDQTAEANRIRFVTMSRPADNPDAWIAATRRVNDQTDTATYNRFGRLIRSESSDGLIKRPIEFQRLFRLWESKGLPLD